MGERKDWCGASEVLRVDSGYNIVELHEPLTSK